MSARSDHLTRLHELACTVCRNCYGRNVAAADAHHIEAVRGDHSDWATIPLCRACHESLHRSHRNAFYTAHKLSDVKLLAWTIQQLMERS